MQNEILPHELVSNSDYFRNVLGNMVASIAEKEARRVRFGTTGDGVSPHYEISYPDGHTVTRTYPFSGQNHKPFQDVSSFDTNNLSEKYTFSEVQSMLAKVLERKG